MRALNIVKSAAVIWLSCLNLATAQDHPAFGAEHTSPLIVETKATDIPKLEARAVAILRNEGLTLNEARSKVRIDGKTDVARCKEVIITRAILKEATLGTMRVTVANEHPQ